MWSEIPITTLMSCSISRTPICWVVADVEQQLVELGGFARVEAGRRLVEAEQHRLGAHGARDLQPALRAIGQVARLPVGAVGEADPLQPVARELDRLALGLAVDAAGRAAPRR